jgi:hypothetical protein
MLLARAAKAVASRNIWISLKEFMKQLQSDQRFVAEMRRLYDQNNIAGMTGEEILAYHVMKGLSNVKFFVL